MRTALSLSGIYQWIYEDRKQALAIHTELAIHYHPLDISSTPHLTEIDDMIERKQRGAVGPFDMYDDTKLTRRNYASSYAQVIQHAIRALNLLPPSGNRTHEDQYYHGFERLEELSHKSMHKMVKFLFRQCHLNLEDRNTLALHNLRRSMKINPDGGPSYRTSCQAHPIFDHFHIGPPTQLWLALQRPTSLDTEPLSLLSFPSMEDPTHPMLTRGVSGTMCDRPIYLFSIPASYKACRTTWSRDDDNSAFFCRYASQRIRNMGQPLRRIPSIPYGDSLHPNDPRRFRITSDGHTPSITHWPDDAPWDDTTTPHHCRTNGPFIDEPLLASLATHSCSDCARYPRMGAPVDILDYHCYDLPNYVRTVDDYPASTNTGPIAIPAELAIDIGFEYAEPSSWHSSDEPNYLDRIGE